MDRRILVAAVIAVMVIVVAGFAAWRASEKTAGLPGIGPNSGTGDDSGFKTREDVSSGTRVPDSGSNVAEDVAKPQIVAPAAADSKLSKRIFDIRIDNGKIDTPNIVLYAGDLITLNITAVDRAYDLTQPDYGLKFNLKAGETKTFDNQFSNPGKYLFYCESCGGPEKGPTGYFTVVPKQ